MTYGIRLASSEDLPYLMAIEIAAEALFPLVDLPMELRAINTSLADFGDALSSGLLWVAIDREGQPIAFLLATQVDKCLHIAEFDVHPSHGKRGIGTRLLKHVLGVAEQRAFSRVTLTTFEHLPWNAPFYARHGFRILSGNEIGPGLREILLREEAAGLKRRVAMELSIEDIA